LLRGHHPCGRHCSPCWWQGWPRATVPCGCPTAGPVVSVALPAAAAPCGLALAAAGFSLLWGLGRGLVVGGRPCMGAGLG
ncbi:hypothetical protein BHE74_00058436, partial [Ensete ventricosum]